MAAGRVKESIVSFTLPAGKITFDAKDSKKIYIHSPR